MDKDYTVYVLKFPNGKRYVGMTRQGVDRRWSNGSGYRNNVKMYPDIQKYGWNNVDKSEIYDHLDRDGARALERTLISAYDSINNGYNSTDGGECGSDVSAEFDYNGETLDSHQIAEMCDGEINSHDITTRVNHHKWDLDRAMNQKKMQKNIKFDYNGGSYTTKELMQFSKVPDLTLGELRTRLLHHKWSVERALTQPTNVKVQPFGVGDRVYEYNGKMYNSYELVQISDVKGLTVGDITSRINHHGWSVEDAITKPKKGRLKLYEYNGGQYTTLELAEMSPYDVTCQHITDRLRMGWTVKEAIETPIGQKRKK